MVVSWMSHVFQILPAELIAFIFNYLPLRPLARCFQTCKALHLLSKRPTTWRDACLRIHPTIPFSVMPSSASETFWKETCRTLIRNPKETIFNYYTPPLNISMKNARLSFHGKSLLCASDDTYTNDRRRHFLIARELSDLKCIGGSQHPFWQQSVYNVGQFVHIGSKVFHIEWNNSTSSSARVSDLQNPLIKNVLGGHTAKVFWIAADPSRNMVVTAGMDGTARVWDATTLACAHVLRNGHVGFIHTVAIAPQSFIVTAGQDRAIVVWDPTTGQELHTIRIGTGDATSCGQGSLAALGNIVAWHNLTSKSDEIVCYDVSAKKEMFRIDISWRHAQIPGGISLLIRLTPQFLFTNCGRQRDGTMEYLTYWDLGTGEKVGTLNATPLPHWDRDVHNAFVTGLVVSPEERQVIAAMRGGLIMVWKFDKGPDGQREADRVYADTNASAPLLEDDDGDDDDGDSDDSDMGYGNYGTNFVPRGRKYWRQG
ncbi:hypothetical protein HK097_004456 [Rhizophlyctis rosea]|uniref:F-box domain-containing protein n=1 Tax=Rhizophlyctis rosea TaxID=64517 RepID=A0AAD5SG37_9FUNG|nr:hypothetical protein HK097_004456 [Rhizophlyctis rosea]